MGSAETVRQPTSDRARVAPARAGGRTGPTPLGDFTTTSRVILLAGMAIVIGALSALVATALIRLIALFTNLFYYQRWSTAAVSPAGHHLGVAAVLVPVGGALIVGLLARFGSDRIRGHGIPEAIEAILIGGSRLEPKVAVLKPLSSAISIGSGGPFGAEGPIIMTGGAFGSLVAQFLHLTSSERRTLLVAGAAGGMAATFASPLAAVMLAVELLLFEWKPRSFVPVALASVTAAVVRRPLLGPGPLFPTAPHDGAGSPWLLLGCVLTGLLAGGLSFCLTQAVYAAEDSFGRLPVHWMWWPVLGGLAVGIGGLVFPRGLGVGYDVIADLLTRNVALKVILGVLVVKALMWAVALGSGTSGGVLAPLLMMGCALGALEAHVLPNPGPGFWPLVSMGATLGGTMRSPLTGIVFALELTHDLGMLLPLLAAVVVAHLVTVLTMPRSILTEKVARRGFHVSREYAVDPLETLRVHEVMRDNIEPVPAAATPAELASRLRDRRHRGSTLFPVADDSGRLVGVATRSAAAAWARGPDRGRPLGTFVSRPRAVAYPDEPLRVIAFRMAETRLTRLPVVESEAHPRFLGMIFLVDLLKARAHHLDAEHRRERVLRLPVALARRPGASKAAGRRSISAAGR